MGIGQYRKNHGFYRSFQNLANPDFNHILKTIVKLISLFVIKFNYLSLLLIT